MSITIPGPYVFPRSRAHRVLLSAEIVDTLSRRHQWVLKYYMRSVSTPNHINRSGL